MRRWLSWRRSWLASYAIIGFVGPGLAAILLPLVVVDAGHRPFRVGAVVAAQNCGVLFAPLWGWCSDRWRLCRTLLVGGLIVIALGFAGLSVETRLSMLLVSAFLIGLGTGGCNTMVNLLVVASIPPSQRGVGFGRLQTFGALGVMLGLGVGGRMSPQSGMILATCLMLAAALVAALGDDNRDVDRGNNAAFVAEPAMGRTSLVGTFNIFLSVWFVFSLAVSVFASLYPITMSHSFDVSVRASSTAIAVATFVSLPLYEIAGRLIPQLGSARLMVLGITGRLVPLAVLACLAVLKREPILPVLVLAGLFQAEWPLLGVAANDLTIHLAPRGVGLSVGLFNAVGAVASGLGALMSGLVADVLGFRTVNVLAAALCLAALIGGLFLNRMTETVSAARAV